MVWPYPKNGWRLTSQTNYKTTLGHFKILLFKGKWLQKEHAVPI